MGATLDALHRLQSIERQLSTFKQQLANKQRNVEAHTRRVAALDEDIQKQREELRRQQMEADRLEVERRGREDGIAKLRVSLNSAKTNKEYAAILTRINTDKADNAKLEDKILQLLTRVDELRKVAQELQAQRDQEAQRLAKVQEELSQSRAAIQVQIEQLQARRAEAAAQVPPSALRIFERVAGRNNGEAMALIDRPDPRHEEWICQGCNMTVTLEQVNALRTRDEVQQCHVCGRILYLEGPAG